MERGMLGISLLDHVPNDDIRRRTKVVDAGRAKLKWKWAGHLARRDDGRWTKAVTGWWPRDAKRPRGISPTRWIDDIKVIVGNHWTRLARDRKEWRNREEAYSQQWVQTGTLLKPASTKDSSLALDLIINPKHHGLTLNCATKFEEHVITRIVVELVYEPNETLPEAKRPNLSNAILYEIKRKELGDDCDTTNTNITVKTGPLMVKVSGDYDLVDHIWCQSIVHEEGENPEIFLTKKDFCEYENPKEAIAIIDTVDIGGNHTEWNCTMLTRKDALDNPY
ncbi:uncharacterized protein LOC113238829 [Hyposmocoma kahamanoa]|uniref:uncharacterized protein LOC113238829 n=1 Tax=Hyposmocoma kahamanoa TaxID=1477025 RepID=UPI000E6D86A7|nr:uncharacterized protein LOC113238829 [Hyposmocoma kahamanoa]